MLTNIITSVEQFLAHYAWAGTIIAFLAGLLLGPGFIWKWAEVRQKSQSAVMEQIRLEKELYERLQVLQNEVSSALLRYIGLRDRLFEMNEDQKEYNQVRDEYNAAKENVASLVREYHQLEVRLSALERRSPRFLVIPLPPNNPTNPRVEKREDGEEVIRWDYSEDPLRTQINNDVKALFQQYGHKFPSDR